MLLWSVNSYLAPFRGTSFLMTPFLAPAPKGPFVFTSPHSLPSLAFPLPWACGLPCSVLVGASSVRFQLSAGICRAVFAFPVRCEDNIYVCEFYVNKNFIYVYIESKNTADTTKARRSRPAGHKKPLTRRGKGRLR